MFASDRAIRISLTGKTQQGDGYTLGSWSTFGTSAARSGTAASGQTEKASIRSFWDCFPVT
jgi:hypothetical protein